MDYRRKLHSLEQVSSLLEPSPAFRAEVREEVVQYAEKFLNAIHTLPAFEFPRPGSKIPGGLFPGNDPVPIGTLLDALKKDVDTPGLNPASGGHLGYIPGGGIYFSALGDYLADIFNRYAGIFYAGPGAVRMENLLIRWMARITGFPEEAAGNLTSGGSLANLMAIVTARDAKNIGPEKIRSSVIYLSEQSHHSVQKAIRISGLSECVHRHVRLDSNFRMKPDHLKELLQQDKAAGLDPFLLVANAGTTDTGAIDPLEDLSEISRANGMWMHVDAAYGGFFVLTDQGSKKLKGMSLADSLTIDPHKGLFLPYGLGTVLVKNKLHLNASHRYTANYMQDSLQANEELSPADLSPELTKHFRGLRLWLPLLLHGTAPFTACLEEKLLLALYFHEELQKIGFRVGPPPDLSVVIYRFIPKQGDADAFNLALQEKVVRDGRVFISSTRIDGEVWLRFACLAFRTHLSTIDTLLEVLRNETKNR
ncbi:MAG: aminotransferase class I/II-fold pyridoxal phosphate-dependent enzyme [Bacteroidia bacterium]|nr:aminotransferase class I/II-fold pyridoxal phosphate-dependent enzyme [Bacteroidia bacterium]